jgi:hypothetical protein
MNYIEYMHNLRAAMKLVREKIPQIKEAAEKAYLKERDEDIRIALMSDEEFYKLQTKYEEVEPSLYRFNPEEEYGMVHTMWPEDMRGS